MREEMASFMGFIKIALLATVVGAITMAPTQLLSATAAILGSATSSSQSITSNNYGAVAGASSSATATAAHVVTTATPICFPPGKSTSGGNTSSGSSSIKLNSVTSLAVGMIISATTGIAAGTKVTVINSGTSTVTITPITTAQIGNNTPLTFSGCYQAYFNVNNINSLALLSFQIQQSVTTTTPDNITVQSCAGTWTEATGVCSGAITDIVSTSSGTSAFTDVSTPLAASTGTIRLRALCNTSGQSSTISINIARVNVRAAITTNS